MTSLGAGQASQQASHTTLAKYDEHPTVFIIYHSLREEI
jgi:hypothetical protein